MKKVRDIPPEWQGLNTQSPEYQEHLQRCIEEEGQTRLVKSFMEGREDKGLPLEELDYQLLLNCRKPIPNNNDLDEKPSIWEEGEEVCYSYGMLTLRGLIRWTLQSGKISRWLVPALTVQGEQALTERKE
jgi:hypothetical protein